MTRVISAFGIRHSSLTMGVPRSQVPSTRPYIAGGRHASRLLRALDLSVEKG